MSNRLFFSAVAKLGGGTALSQVILLLGLPILTRLYSPEVFGVYSFFISTTFVVSVFFTFRIEMLLPKLDGQAKLDVVSSLFIFATVASAVTLGAGGLLSVMFDALSLDVLVVFTAAVLVFSINKLFLMIAIDEGRYTSIGLSKLIINAVSLSIQLLISTVWGKHLLVLLIGYLVGLLSALLMFCVLFRDAVSAYWAGRRMTLGVVFSNRHLLKYDAGAALLNIAAIEAPVLIMLFLYAPEIVGNYAVVQRILGAPITLISQAVSQVYYGRLTKEGSTFSLRRLFRHLQLGFAALSTVPVGVMMFWGEDVFVFVFGKEWSGAGVYAGVLIFSFIGQFLFVAVSTTFVALNRPRINFFLQAALLLFRVLVLAFGWWSGMSIIYVFSVYSLASLLVYLSGILMAYRLLV